ncbi:Cell shape-determining protein MreC [Candidatus Terasakiella magnetica]|uniref:Cell shape-determining protein MreC n=1 Tax=Candidatus Terasakiella magnetica TaxID=1867952 RepID=A0A1C3REH1_9PROT|nr:rod shape-determining protein MreC [Candidatus Terasakiella magnetica]SCA55655.1 Cell shape-determining protein MreC [Candidatus Terasakiella magnetica]
MKSGPGAQTRVDMIRNLLQRFAYLGLILAAFGLMMLGKAETIIVEEARARINDAFAPILEAIAEPAETVRNYLDEGRQFLSIHSENVRLTKENQRLLQWQTVARKVQSENETLRGLLNYQVGPESSYQAARVISDDGGIYSESMLVYAGNREGLKNGQAVVTGEGLVGRIAGVAHRSARVLLLSDLNSRIPVMIESSRARGIMAGRNEDKPILTKLPPGTIVSPGDRIVTSGHGGAFPQGIPVGQISAVDDISVEVTLYVDTTRLEIVRIVDYGLEGILDRNRLRTDLPKNDIPVKKVTPIAPKTPEMKTVVPKPGTERRPSEP